MTPAAEAAPSEAAAGPTSGGPQPHAPMVRGAALIPLMLLLSGFAGLGYQIVWIRMLSIGLGHEVFAVLAVVAAFFAGLALGAVALDGRIAKSRRPGLWYAGLEIVIGLWTLALVALIPLANLRLAAWMGPEPSEIWRWTVAFGGTALLLLPATAAMGATLPAAERLYARARRSSRGIGGLYGANAAGAMAGALLTAVLIAPAVGFTATLWIFAAANFAAAAVVLAGPARGEADRPPLPAAEAGRGPSPRILVVLAITGLLGVGFEVAVVRALAQILENTVYSFAAVLSVYLLGTAIGAAAYQRAYAQRRRDGWDGSAVGFLAGLTGAACALGTLAVFVVPEVYSTLRSGFGETVRGSIAAEILAAALVILAPSAAMGAFFSHLAQGARGPSGGLGAAFAANTLGAALAPVAVGVLAIPALGVMASLVALSAAYLVLLPLAAGPGRGGRTALAGLTAAAALAALFGPFERRLVLPPPGGRILEHREGVAAAASILEDRAGDRWLRVNGTFTMGGTASYALDRVQGHAALLRHPDPSRALFLGIGTGASVAAAADYPDLRTEAVDLLPEVLALVPAFPQVTESLAAAGERIRLGIGDARRRVRTGDDAWDVIVSDNFHPAKDGSGLLYTVEHFAAVRDRLTPDGVFVQWLPLHQLDLATLRLIVRSFLAVFPDATLSMGNYNLVTPILALSGHRDGARPSLARLAERMADAPLAEPLARVGLGDPFAVFGRHMAGAEALAAFAGPGPLNTDDHPRVLFEAPRTVYAPLGSHADRLLGLVARFEPDPAAVARLDGGPADFAPRLRAYWRARDAFLAFGRSVSVTGDIRRDARAMAPRLLEIVRMSPDFREAYDPVLAIARALAGVRPEAALQLLAALDAAHPRRDDARRLAAQLRRLRP